MNLTNGIEIKRVNIGDAIYYLCYYSITVILLFSGISKIVTPEPMFEILEALGFGNDSLMLITASLLPVIEIGIASLMILKLRLNVVIISAVILFAIFLAISIYGSIIGLDKDCGCFGGAVESSFGAGMILRNSLFLITAIYIKMKTARLFN